MREGDGRMGSREVVGGGLGLEPTYSRIGPQLDEEPLALEAQLADLGPVEGVDLGVALKKQVSV